LIATGQRYEIRPDILLLEGYLDDIQIQGQIVHYKYRYSPDLLLEGALRVSNSRILPIVERRPAKDIPLAVLGVVECSVNKTGRVASAQIEGYRTAYGFLEDQSTVLVTGNEIGSDCGPMTQVNLATTDPSVLSSSLQQAGEYIRVHLVEPGVA
jgi:hypothetical protein